jgi:hypothetical protein
MKSLDITADTLHAAAVLLKGFSMYESGGTSPAIVVFRNGGVGGQILATVPLAADEGATLQYDQYLTAEDGVYVQVTGGGTLTGVLYHIDIS